MKVIKSLILLSLFFRILPVSGSEMVISLKNGDTDSLSLNDIISVYFADSSFNAIVRLSEPFNGAANIPLTPILKWRVIPGQEYELMLSDKSDFSTPIINICGLDSNYYQVTDTLQSHTTYYWKVRSSNTYEWSATWQFTTYTPAPPGKIYSLAIVNGGLPNSLEIRFKSDDDLEQLIVLLSSDGLTFDDTVQVEASSPIISGVEAGKMVFIKIKAANSAGTGPVSETLVGIPMGTHPKVMIINGFDRASAGNSYNFIRQHATALAYANQSFESASNDALTDGLISLADYEIIDIILGEESTVDETFSDAEQDSVEKFLQTGGKLFVSGSEIAWDLDYKGSRSDKSFCHNFLKIGYAADAPNNQSNTWYAVEALTGTMFSDLPGFSFDNGSHGTYNVDWPDVFSAADGGKGFLKYKNHNAGNVYSGVLYEGMFPGGTTPGKLVIIGFPFETIYPVENRNIFMRRIIEFFEHISDIDNATAPLTEYRLLQNYPNPFNNCTIIPFHLPKANDVTISVYDLLGRQIYNYNEKYPAPGYHQINFNGYNLSSGEYLYTMKSGSYRAVKKFCIIK